MNAHSALSILWLHGASQEKTILASKLSPPCASPNRALPIPYPASRQHVLEDVNCRPANPNFGPTCSVDASKLGASQRAAYIASAYVCVTLLGYCHRPGKSGLGHEVIKVVPKRNSIRFLFAKWYIDQNRW